MLATGVVGAVVDPWIRWSWISGHADVITAALIQHIQLTAIAVGVGLVIAVPLGLVAWRSRLFRGPIFSLTGILYTIPSLALFSALVPFTGFTILTAEIGLVSYTLLILIRNIVVGLNSVRPWRRQSGGVSDEQLKRATTKLQQVSGEKLRVVALHHQMVGAPWRTRKKPVARRTHVLATLVDCGAELIVGGHIHQGTVSERHEFEVVTGDVRGVVVSIAPGLGQPRPQRRGEARGCIVYRAEERTLTVDTYIWRDDDWGLTAVRTFPRGPRPLAVEAT